MIYKTPEKERIARKNYYGNNAEKCRRASNKWYHKHHERALATAREYYAKNRIEINAYKKRWRLKNPALQRARAAQNSLRHYWSLKDAIYGKLGQRCNSCGIEDTRVLCIDHVNNDGYAEYHGKNRTARVSTAAYLKKVLGDSDNCYQILCHNCNWIKRYEHSRLTKQAA